MAVQGGLSPSKWVKDGQRHERLEVVAAAVTFLGQRPPEQAQPEAAPTEEEAVAAAA